MAGESRFGVEVLRVQRPEEVGQLDWWIHDGYVEDAIEFDAEAQRAVIPFGQESAWGTDIRRWPTQSS